MQEGAHMKIFLCKLLLIVLTVMQYGWGERIIPIIIAGAVVGDVAGTIAEDVVEGVIEAENNNAQTSSNIAPASAQGGQVASNVPQIANELSIVEKQSWFRALAQRVWEVVVSIPNLCKFSWHSIAALLFIAKK